MASFDYDKQHMVTLFEHLGSFAWIHLSYFMHVHSKDIHPKKKKKTDGGDILHMYGNLIFVILMKKYTTCNKPSMHDQKIIFSLNMD